jgi:peptidoglycan/LPS O-acetylase OafA/YrhL
MLAVYLICLVIGIGVFFSLWRFPMSIRWVAAVLATIILSIVVTVFIARIGDRPVGETRTINKQDLP